MALSDLVACRVRRVLSSGASLQWFSGAPAADCLPCGAWGPALLHIYLSPAPRLAPPTDAGGQQSVMEGLTQLAQLVAEGGSRISVMCGGGLTEENVGTVVRVTGETCLPA